jgi:transporter family protein
MALLIHSWLFWAFLAALFAALVSVLAKGSLERIDPDVAQFFRTAIILVVVTLVVLPRGRWTEVSQWSTRIWLLLGLSGVATALSWLCYFRALDLGEASRVAAVDKLSVVIVALLGAAFLSERLGALGWFGVLLVSIGLVMISLRG